MKRLARIAVLAALAPLAGCLEVDQHPPWIDGAYDGKADMLAPQARFHGDRLAWTAVIDNRTQLQNEYGRARP